MGWSETAGAWNGVCLLQIFLRDFVSFSYQLAEEPSFEAAVFPAKNLRRRRLTSSEFVSKDFFSFVRSRFNNVLHLNVHLDINPERILESSVSC
jgi:hypothetical protein